MKIGPLVGCALVVGLAGCGLKTPLGLPEKTGNVVIRGPQQATAPATTPTPGSTTTGTHATPATPKDAPSPSKLERLPPPPLPSGNAGSRGG